MAQGYLSIILHAHLPYVRHPEHDRFLEEQWFYEALTETYIPLLKAFHALMRDGVDFKVTMSLTPTLLSMMDDDLLCQRYVDHLHRMIDLAQKEIIRTAHDSRFHTLAKMYHRIFSESLDIFEKQYHGKIYRAFKEVQDAGKLEIITCCATHGFLPLMQIQERAVRAQIRMAAKLHERLLGRRPRGIWLAECGYYPGVDEILKEEGIKFFVVDTHAVLFGKPRPKYGVFAPVYCPSGVAAFARDSESSKSVWSAEEGYPGDHFYREFYRDIGFDLDYDYVKPYLNGDGCRVHTGIKYYRITGSNHKEPYDPTIAAQKAHSHAGNFMFNRQKQVEHLSTLMDRAPIIVSPYDAELYGHWWFEGPQWLESLFRKMHHDQDAVKTITPMEYLQKYPVNQRVEPTFSSWGNNGYAEVWLNGSNDWIYRHLHHASKLMQESTDKHPNPDEIQRRTLNQMARELLLAQSSDWAFIMKTGTHTSYAEKRTKDHVSRFLELYEALEKNCIDTTRLQSIEFTDNIFPDMDYKVYA